jgi:hypothetical protein
VERGDGPLDSAGNDIPVYRTCRVCLFPDERFSHFTHSTGFAEAFVYSRDWACPCPRGGGRAASWMERAYVNAYGACPCPRTLSPGGKTVLRAKLAYIVLKVGQGFNASPACPREFLKPFLHGYDGFFRPTRR